MHPGRTVIQNCIAGSLLIAAAAGCRHTIAVEPIEVKPIHMTLDINLKVDRELDQFFEDIEPATQPQATQPQPALPATSATAPAPMNALPSGGTS